MSCWPRLGQPGVCIPVTQGEMVFTALLFSIKEKLRSGELEVKGDQWPTFLYAGYDYDPEDPWNGLLRSTILVSVSRL